MAQVPIAISSNVMVIPVNLSSMSKTFTLPVVSTNQGRMLIFKDYYGNSANSTIRLSTIGLDRIERSSVSSMALSQTFGAWTFMNDGRTNWFLTDVYQNTLPIEIMTSYLPGLWTRFIILQETRLLMDLEIVGGETSLEQQESIILLIFKMVIHVLDKVIRLVLFQKDICILLRQLLSHLEPFQTTV